VACVVLSHFTDFEPPGLDGKGVMRAGRQAGRQAGGGCIVELRLA
jgi:hypothetical protein